jgi:hypothetical protein
MRGLTTLLCLVAGCLLLGCRREAQPPLRAAALTAVESLPDWARTGRFRVTRWDGGPIEAEKGRLSGWPHFTLRDEKGVMAATRDWYNPRTVELLKTAHLNWAWVTWSVGFSHHTEKPQWEQVRRYIEECHRSGIKVTAYISVGNMFWKEMFQNEPASRGWVEMLPEGSPRFYRFPHRYMADITSREWLDYVRARVREAINAGADGFWVDNTFAYHGAHNVERFLAEVYEEASKAGRKIVIESNYNQSIYTWARFQNGVTTEDGQEPGYYPDDSEAMRLVTNAGLLRYQWGISASWRPVSAEYGRPHRGDRYTTPMEPRKWQLALAECAAFQASLEPAFEGMLLRDLYFGETKAQEKLKAIGHYNAFLEQYEEYSTDPQSAAKIAVLADTTDRLIPMLNQLSSLNLQYDVVFNYQEPVAERLKQYAVVLLPHTNPVSNRLSATLQQYARDGGSLVAIQDASMFPMRDESRPDMGLAEALGISARQLPVERKTTSFGSGKTVYYPAPPDVSALAAELKQIAADSEILTVKAPPGVLFNVVRQEKENRLILHLLNYTQQKTKGIAVRVRGQVKAVRVLSPDVAPSTVIVKSEGGFSQFEAPELLTYDLVVISL